MQAPRKVSLVFSSSNRAATVTQSTLSPPPPWGLHVQSIILTAYYNHAQDRSAVGVKEGQSCASPPPAQEEHEEKASDAAGSRSDEPGSPPGTTAISNHKIHTESPSSPKRPSKCLRTLHAYDTYVRKHYLIISGANGLRRSLTLCEVFFQNLVNK